MSQQPIDHATDTPPRAAQGGQRLPAFFMPAMPPVGAVSWLSRRLKRRRPGPAGN